MILLDAFALIALQRDEPAAAALEGMIATADRPILAAARAESIDTVPLPDARGEMY
jgi:uncharacterized protein with PIN domain